MKNQTTTLKINLPVKTVEAIQHEVASLGWSVQDFIRFRISNYFDYPDWPLSDDEKKQIAESKKDIKAGRVTTISNDEELEKFFKDLHS